MSIQIKPNWPEPTLGPQTKLFAPADLFYFLALLVVALKIVYTPFNVVDIMLADESYYLSMAQHFQLKHLFTDGFIYFLWLKFLLLFFPDMVVLYFMNYAILVTLNPVLFYIFSKKSGHDGFTSLLLALFFLVSTANVFTWPFITRFAIAVFLLTLLGVAHANTIKKRVLVTGFGLVLLLYVRPEFLLSFILFALILGLILILPWIRSRQRENGWLLALLLMVLCFVTVIKNPASPQRSLMAFGQHYGANLVEREKIKLNPWTQWQQVVEKKFGPSKSALEAFFRNPIEVKKHVVANLKKVVPTFYYQLFPYHSHTMSRPLRRVYSILILFLGGAALFNFAWMIRQRTKTRQVGRWWSGIWDDHELLFYGIILLVMIPVVLSIMVVFPRTHYILICFAIGYGFIIHHLPKLPRLPQYLAPVKILVILALVYLFPWVASGTAGIKPGTIKTSCTTVTRIQAVKSIPVQRDVRMLLQLYTLPFNNEYFQMYVRSHNPHHYAFFEPTSTVSLTRFIQINHINMIYVNQKLLTFPSWDANRELATLMANGPQREWTQVKLPGGKEYILVKKSIL